YVVGTYKKPPVEIKISQLDIPSSTSYVEFIIYGKNSFGKSEDGATVGLQLEVAKQTLPSPAFTSISEGEYPDKINVSWTSVSGATSYRLFRVGVKGEEIDYKSAITIDVNGT